MTARERTTQVLKAIATPVASMPDKIIGWLAKLPTTNARIAVTLGVVIGTAMRYWWSNPSWEPSGEWLTFLVAMSGMDSAQFYAKRATHSEYKNGNGKPPENGNGTSGPGGA